MTAPVAGLNPAAQRRIGQAATSKVPVLPDPDRFNDWMTLVAALIVTGGRASSALAVRQYLAARPTTRTRFTPIPAPPAPLEQIQESLRWAAFAPGTSDPRTRAQGITQRLVMNPGRDTVIDATADDPVATGYARVPRPGACAFCLLLASRGSTYKSAASALRIGNTDRPFHDDCACVTVPEFEGDEYEPPEHVRAAEELYRTAASGTADPISEFRRALAEQRNESPGG